MARSNYLKNKLLDHAIGGPAFTRPTNLYLALMTAMPTAAGGGTEVPLNNGYARKQIPNNTTFFGSAASAQSKANTQPIEFAAASGGSWAGGANILGVGLYDAPSGGNLHEFTELDAPVVVTNQSILLFRTGDLVFEDLA